jgi:hypothetical protein
MKRIIAHIMLTLSMLMPLAIITQVFLLIRQVQHNMIYLDMPRTVFFIVYLILAPLSAYGFYNAYKDLMYSYRLTHYAEDRFE